MELLNKNNWNAADLLRALERQAGSVYLVRASSSGSENLPRLIEKIRKANAIAVEIPQDTPNLQSLRSSLPQELFSVCQVKFPFTEIPIGFDFLEIQCRSYEISTLLREFQYGELNSYRNQAFVTFLDYPAKDLGHLPAFQALQIPFYFEFSHFAAGGESSLAVQEIRRLLKACRDINVPVTPPPGRPIWDETIPTTLELEPLVPITFQIGNATKAANKVEFSVIIPTYNSKYYLLNVIRHFAFQDFPKDQYEVIVIDDGSTDGSQEYIKSHLERDPELKNFKYIYWPRPGVRTRGDSYFRAGLSRNLGVYHSSGEFVSFVDSDMLVAPQYLSSLKRDLQSFDVIQNVRYHIQPELSNESVRYDQIQVGKETFIEDEKYWGSFFKTTDWSTLQAYWKYTCTYNLTMSKKTFLEVGRFRRNFVSYGFEDTDLGYRLSRAGKKFHLSSTYSLHLTPSKSESEYRHSQIHRHILLSKTAKKFFLNNLDPFIYDHLNVYMGGEYPRLRALFRWLKGLFRASPEPID